MKFRAYIFFKTCLSFGLEIAHFSLINDKMEVLEEIDISGATFVTIDHDEEGLVVLTHKDTNVVMTGNTLTIRDPVKQFETQSNTGSWFGSRNGNSFICNINGASNMHNMGNCVIMNGNVVSGNSFSVMGVASCTKEECNTAHHFNCDYEHIRRITTKGSMETTMKIPLDTTRASVSIMGTGYLYLNSKQTFTMLNVNVDGTSSLEVSPVDIGTLTVSMAGTGNFSLCHRGTTIDNLIVTNSGTGKTMLAGAIVDTAVISLSGTVSVGDVKITGDADLEVSGVASIECHASRSARINRHKLGLGRITIKRDD